MVRQEHSVCGNDDNGVSGSSDDNGLGGGGDDDGVGGSGNGDGDGRWMVDGGGWMLKARRCSQ